MCRGSSSQPSCSAIPKVCEGELVKHEKQGASKDKVKDDSSYAHNLRCSTLNQEDQERCYRAKHGCHLQKAEVLNLLCLWRTKGHHGPPAPIPVGQRVHKLF